MQSTEASLNARIASSRYFVAALSAIVILILMMLISDRINLELENAEKAQFEFRVAELKAAVLLMEASLVAKSDMGAAFKYEGLNPMTLLKDETSHYLGEMPLSNAANKPGNWVFDPEQKIIAYLPKNSWLDEPKKQGEWLRFKVVALWSKEHGNLNTGVVGSSHNHNAEQSVGLALKAL